MEISFQQCKQELLDNANPHGQAAYAEWRQRAGYGPVIAFVEGFTHRQRFRLWSGMIRDVMKRSDHALGDVRKEEALKSIEDYTCPFAVQHMFHAYIEEKGTVPAWQEFDAYINTEAREKWLEPLRQVLASFPEVNGLIAKMGREKAWEQGQAGNPLTAGQILFIGHTRA
jgi:hypothetical protein